MKFRSALLASTVLAFAFAASDTSAQSTTERVYDVVTEYTVTDWIAFTGVLSGASAPSSITLRAGTGSFVPLHESCERALIQVVNPPGRLACVVGPGPARPGAETSFTPRSCSVRQKP